MVGSVIFDADTWAHVPFHFWSVVFFVLGCLVGSFLNVCIHRMPLGQSIVSPPSHCPHCNYSIPAYLNIPLVTWLYLRGKCANCGAVISARYFLVELLTGFLFMFCWLNAGHISVFFALVQCVFVGGLIVGTFIDIEHLIIPDEITLGGTVVGFFFSLVVPSMHHTKSSSASLGASFLGILVGGDCYTRFCAAANYCLDGSMSMPVPARPLPVHRSIGAAETVGRPVAARDFYRVLSGGGRRPNSLRGYFLPSHRHPRAQGPPARIV